MWYDLCLAGVSREQLTESQVECNEVLGGLLPEQQFMKSINVKMVQLKYTKFVLGIRSYLPRITYLQPTLQ